MGRGKEERGKGKWVYELSDCPNINKSDRHSTLNTLNNFSHCCRLKMIPTLLRMRNEFSVFRDSAIRDLNYSIQLLEKARTEYRAALLWMKNVSEKLHDPDYKNQLIRFREVNMIVNRSSLFKVLMCKFFFTPTLHACWILSSIQLDIEQHTAGY